MTQLLKRTIWIAIGLVLAVFLYFLLKPVFAGRVLLPQYFFIGPLQIRFYGLTMALAILGGFFLALYRAKKYGFNSDFAENIIFWLVVGGFIGARIYHVFSDIVYYSHHFLQIFEVWRGGLSIFGAVLGGLFTLWILKRADNNQFSFLTILDWLAPSVILGQIIGRFGNFFNYEAFGYPTNLPWKMFVPFRFRPLDFSNFSFFHPLFLYEQLGNVVILFFLLWYTNRKTNRRPVGGVFFFYLLLYNCIRFFLEFQRTDSTFIYGRLRLNVLASLILSFIAGFCLIKIHYDKKIT